MCRFRMILTGVFAHGTTIPRKNTPPIGPNKRPNITWVIRNSELFFTSLTMKATAMVIRPNRAAEKKGETNIVIHIPGSMQKKRVWVMYYTYRTKRKINPQYAYLR